MQRSKTEFYYHFVWATYRRIPLLNEKWEPEVHACIRHEAIRQGARVLALGGIADHVHLAVTLPPRIAVSRFMQQVKGVSSTFARQKLANGDFFGWQDHYGGFSFSHTDISRVVRYIENQKQHHADGTLNADWEQTEEDAPPTDKTGGINPPAER